MLQCWWALMDHPWVSESPTHHWHAVTKQSELAHYWAPSRRPLQYRCTVIHLLVTLFPHNKLESQAAKNSMQKIGIAHTVNFNQSPLLCVSPACLVFGIPLRSGWPWWRRTEESQSSWLQGEVWRMEWVGCRGDMVVVVVRGAVLWLQSVSGIYRIERRLYWALIRFKPPDRSCFIHTADVSLAQMTMQNICKTQHRLNSKTLVLYDNTLSTLTT